MLKIRGREGHHAAVTKLCNKAEGEISKDDAVTIKGCPNCQEIEKGTKGPL